MSSSFIVLIDWSDGGHNATHFRAFVDSLRDLGCEVHGIVSRALGERVRAGAMPVTETQSPTFQKVEWPGFIPLRPLQLQKALRRRMFANRITAEVARIEERVGRKTDLLFFSCLFEQDFDLALFVVGKMNRPWSFLYLHPYYFHPAHPDSRLNRALAERLLRDSQLKAITTMNEDVAETMTISSRKQVVVFPEITDERTEPVHPLLKRFRDFAGGRTLVVLVGYLGPWKGVAMLARACMECSPEKFAFLFAGELHIDHFPQPDRSDVLQCMANAPHALFHLAGVPDGPAYNAVVSAGDILFAAFDNFPFSSNTITKAALLRKPIIVTENTLSANRVIRYKLGKAIPAGNKVALVHAIETLARYPTLSENGVSESDAQGYLALHSTDALTNAFSKLLDS